MTQQDIRAVTLVENGIHNPNEPRHYMRAKPVAAMVRIFVGERLVAQTRRAVRVLEVGRDLYDPVLYIPKDDVVDGLVAMEGKSTHCPLKGDASYFALSAEDAALDQAIAWTYGSAFDFASDLNGLIAFYGSKVRIEESGPEAPQID